jgi:hypothetical protein
MAHGWRVSSSHLSKDSDEGPIANRDRRQLDWDTEKHQQWREVMSDVHGDSVDHPGSGIAPRRWRVGIFSLARLVTLDVPTF